MNDSRDGKLFIPRGAIVHDVPNPGTAGSKVAETISHKITSWNNHAKDPLFRKETMDVGDINQEGVGDCWYLAALVSIMNLPGGSDLLKKTMVDAGSGRVIVRMFDGALLPHYLRVEKSILWFLGFGKLHVSGLGKTGLWAAMLEKAACCKTVASDRKVCDPLHPNYKNIEGGGGDQAFRMLLGVASQSTTYNNMNQSGAKVGKYQAEKYLSDLFAGGMWGAAIRVESRSQAVKDNMDALNAVFGWNGMAYVRWQEIIKDLKARRRPILAGIGNISTGQAFAELVRAELPQQAAVLIRYAERHRVFSGRSGSGEYSRGALHVFELIKGKLGAHCPVSFGTKDDVGPVERRGHSAGEGMSRGMVGKHAYAVLGVFEENVARRRKYIKISNPWNRFGRTYTDADFLLTPQEQECGTFWIELADFCDVLNNLYTADAPGNGR
jgi:hypothetical protein